VKTLKDYTRTENYFLDGLYYPMMIKKNILRIYKGPDLQECSYMLVDAWYGI
jgi:hypothetical protein